MLPRRLKTLLPEIATNDVGWIAEVIGPTWSAKHAFKLAMWLRLFKELYVADDIQADANELLKRMEKVIVDIHSIELKSETFEKLRREVLLVQLHRLCGKIIAKANNTRPMKSPNRRGRPSGTRYSVIPTMSDALADGAQPETLTWDISLCTTRQCAVQLVGAAVYSHLCRTVPKRSRPEGGAAAIACTLLEKAGVTNPQDIHDFGPKAMPQLRYRLMRPATGNRLLAALGVAVYPCTQEDALKLDALVRESDVASEIEWLRSMWVRL